MQLAKIGARGRTTIPKTIREAADLREGDEITFEIEGDRLVVHKVVLGAARVPAWPGQSDGRVAL